MTCNDTPGIDPLPELARSFLIVPLSSERFITKAHLRGADGITLDLEDGVAPSAKVAARDRLAMAVKQVGRGGARVRVRINRPLDLCVRDLEAAVIPGVSTICIAKVDGAGHVRLVSEFIAKLEAERGLPVGGISLFASIETPAALMRAGEIARADPRLTAIGLGTEDISAACGFEPVPEALLTLKQAVLIAAKAAGIRAMGYVGSIADFTDLEAMRATILRSRRLGFRGGSAIHPAQVPVLNEGFAPTAAEVEDAKAIVEAADIAFKEGRGAFAYKGKMIDKPIVDRARDTLATWRAVLRHEERTRALLAQKDA
jgi:citrate lyase subunit beta / citryl-CoA lyase